MGVFFCPFNLDLFPRLPYNVGMKDKELKIKVDDQFIEKVDYLQKINDFKNRSDTVRKVVEKEYRKEQLSVDDLKLPTWDAEWENGKPQERTWWGNDVSYDFPDCENYKDGRCEVFNCACKDEVACNTKFKKRWEKDDGR